MGGADCGPEGVLRVRRGRVQGVGVGEARVQSTEIVGDGLRAAADGGVAEVGVGPKSGGVQGSWFC